MQIEWRRIWKVLLGCVCTAAGIALLTCGQLGWGLTALEAAVLLLALQYAPRGTRLWKTWWFVELVLALAVTAVKIIATDIDKQVIDKAKTGLYNEKSIASVPEDLKKKYFTKIGPSYQISNDIKSRVEFKQHNLLKDTYPDRCDLIVCRNVLIYFTEEAKDEVFRKFNSALKPDGILFIGSTEQIMNYKEINYERKNSFFYVKAK